jgi:hypothetical protein
VLLASLLYQLVYDMIRLSPIINGPKITIRFVLHKGFVADAIEWHGGISMPFSPGHAECVTPDGRRIGAFGLAHEGQPAGMQVRKNDYDLGDIQELPDGRLCDLWVDLPASLEQSDEFYRQADAALGEPYDWHAMLGFAPFPIHLHGSYHSFCSAKMTLLLRKCNWLKWPLSKPAHEIDPATLLLILSAIVEVPH